MANRAPDLFDQRLAKAFEHPLRIDILGILRSGPSSPARIERQLENVSLNLISHHIKVLADLECIELVETVSKRGAREHIYRAASHFMVTDEGFEELTPTARYRITTSILRAISQDLADSLGTRRFDELPATHISRSPLKLDCQGWDEITDILARTLEEVLEVGDKSLERLAASGEDPVRATIALMKFPTPAVGTESPKTDGA